MGSIFLLYNWYDLYSFNKNPLSKEILHKIKQKEQHLKKLAKRHYNIHVSFPIIIEEKMPAKLFGMAVYGQDKSIKIYLNKKRFKENIEYMIEDVLPHEYAHAMTFIQGDFSMENGGHTRRWQQICQKLEGRKCDRFVTHQDIIIGKTKFLYE